MQYSAEPPVHKSHHFKLTPSPSVPALQARKAIRLAIDCRSFGNTNASKRPVSAEWKIQSSVVSETNGGSWRRTRATFLPQHRFLVALMVRFSSASLRQ